MEMGRISDGPPSLGGRSLSSAKLQESCANLGCVHSRLGRHAPPLFGFQQVCFSTSISRPYDDAMILLAVIEAQPLDQLGTLPVVVELVKQRVFIELDDR